MRIVCVTGPESTGKTTLSQALAERFKVTEDVGEYKAQQGLPAADPEREKEQIARLRKLASSADLDPKFSEAFLRLVIDEVIRRHERVADQP